MIIKFFKKQLVVRLILFLFASPSVGQIVESMTLEQGAFDESPEPTGDPQEAPPYELQTGEDPTQESSEPDEAYIDEVPFDPAQNEAKAETKQDTKGAHDTHPPPHEVLRLDAFFSPEEPGQTASISPPEVIEASSVDGFKAPALLSPSEIEQLSLYEINQIFHQLKVSPVPQVDITTSTMKSTLSLADGVLLEFSIISDHSILLEKEARKRIARALAGRGFRFQHLSPFEATGISDDPKSSSLKVRYPSDTGFDLRPLVVISTPLKTKKRRPFDALKQDASPIELMTQSVQKILPMERLQKIIPRNFDPTVVLLAAGGGLLIVFYTFGLAVKHTIRAKKTGDKFNDTLEEYELPPFPHDPKKHVEVLPNGLPDGLLPPLYTPKAKQTPLSKTPPHREQHLHTIHESLLSPPSADFFTLPNLHLEGGEKIPVQKAQPKLTLKPDRAILTPKFRSHPVSILTDFSPRSRQETLPRGK